MTGLRNLTVRLRARPGGAGRGRPYTARDLLTLIGRSLLWVTVAVVLIRGLGSMAASEPTPAAHESDHERVASWPNDAARAFAVEFAAAYLTYSPTQDPGANRLDAFVAPELLGSFAPRFADQNELRAPVRSVGLAQVAGTVRLDERHALVTVSTAVSVGRREATRHLVVPVARDEHGGLVVYDLPSLAGAPRRASAGRVQGEPLIGAERAEVETVLRRFLLAYMAGDSGGLSYLVPPGTRIAPAGGLELVGLGSITKLAAPTDRELVALVDAQARDVRTRASYALRYRVALVRRDRWYVADVNSGATTGKEPR